MANKTKRLTESAMLLALAVILELVSKTFIPPMTFGGQLTIVCMLPVVLISYRHGVKWVFVAAHGLSSSCGERGLLFVVVCEPLLWNTGSRVCRLRELWFPGFRAQGW